MFKNSFLLSVKVTLYFFGFGQVASSQPILCNQDSTDSLCVVGEDYEGVILGNDNNMNIWWATSSGFNELDRSRYWKIAESQVVEIEHKIESIPCNKLGQIDPSGYLRQYLGGYTEKGTQVIVITFTKYPDSTVYTDAWRDDFKTNFIRTSHLKQNHFSLMVNAATGEIIKVVCQKD